MEEPTRSEWLTEFEPPLVSRRIHRRAGDRLEVSKCPPDLCLRQPYPGAGRRLRRVHQAACRYPRAMKVADGFEPGAVIGPLIDMKAVEKVETHIADALKKGAKIGNGGKRAAPH
jgi:hypothetical protein